MIYGIGTDICDVRRITRVLQRKGSERFARRILAAGEFRTWQARTARWPERGVRYLASRFSAKEAFSKAIGLGLRSPMQWRWCEIGNEPDGKPAVILHGDLERWCQSRNLHTHVSLSDESDYVVSFCVVEQRAVPQESSADEAEC